MNIDRSINGTAWRFCIEKNGDGSHEVTAYVYQCGTWHHRPAYDRFAFSERGARDHVETIITMIRIAGAMIDAARAEPAMRPTKPS